LTSSHIGSTAELTIDDFASGATIFNSNRDGISRSWKNDDKSTNPNTLDNFAVYYYSTTLNDVKTTGIVNGDDLNITNIDVSTVRVTTENAPIVTKKAYIAQLTSIVTNYMVRLTRQGIGIFALITNGLSLVVFVRMTRLKQQVLPIFIALSVVDTFSLTYQFDMAVRRTLDNWSVLRFNAGCKFFKWLQAICQDCSSYFVLLYTVEPYISVRFPLKRNIICTKRRIYAEALL
jgi:hypothetical protein